MKNYFSKNSDVTLVITSCGRFELLKKTLDSFFEFNTYPIREVIITEDSGNKNIMSFIPEFIKDRTHVIINNPKLGQIKSIDLAYSKVETDFIFHCEDDWEFYRPDFIEDSLAIMEKDSKTLQVWLRSYKHDIAVHSPYHFLNERKVINSIPCYKVGSHKEDWQGFSFNPGIKRFSDYKLIGSYGSFPSEKKLSRHYADLNYYAVILENDAVMHTGFGSHLIDVHETDKKKRAKTRLGIKIGLCAITSFIAGYSLGIL